MASIPPLKIGPHTLQSRLIVGSGKYPNYEIMRESILASGADCLTVAIRREKLYDETGKNILDYIDYEKFLLLPNTSGCYNADDAVRTAHLGREILKGLENPGANWVKLEVLGDRRSLLPDPIETLRATEKLVEEGFSVLCYTSDDPIMARRLKNAGAAAVMPAGSPIGSGQGILNPNNIKICLEYLKQDDPHYPVILDAGVGTASDAAKAMELGLDGVLLNTALAHANDPVQMASSMKMAVAAGYLARKSGRMEKQLYANASSPSEGLLPTSETQNRARPSRLHR
ncbi:MAG: thiazole synthase [Pirellulaceae bacterium]|nr:thiazole synthase [Pirellulaceae bacterium]